MARDELSCGWREVYHKMDVSQPDNLDSDPSEWSQ